MSVSKWAYDPDKCDHRMCVGDCDYCPLLCSGTGLRPTFLEIRDPKEDEMEAEEMENERRWGE